MRSARVLATAGACLALLCAASSASADVAPYQGNGDGLGFHDILPPGTNGLANASGLLAYEANGTRPPHNNDQYAMYQDLVYAAPNLKPADLSKYYKDSSFGVRPADVERTETPRSGTTIVRDRFGVPHVYGTTRGDTMFGAGYAAAEDRLFFIDVLRNYGKAHLSSFVGGSQGDREMDRGQLLVAPYTDAELNQQAANLPILYGADGQRVYDDATNFIAGINEYIAEAKLNPNLMPAEYAAIGRPQGPDPWTPSDIIAEASLVGGIFGKGGGTQLAWGQILQRFQGRFGTGVGATLWRDWREPNDPEAPTTVHSGSFPYQRTPAHPAPDSVVLPDPGSLKPIDVGAGAKGSGSSPVSSSATSLISGHLGFSNATGAGAGGLLAGSLPSSDSNALLVSGAHSQSGHPIAVMGPQVAYFQPQILMEEDLHGPGIDARGAAFAGVNLYVELGRGRDYSWSATSAGQAIVDNFAVDLCNEDGSPPSTGSNAYMFRGKCTPMQTVTRSNSWTPNAADSTPPGSETLSVQRTNYGTVIARATSKGRPVAFTELRSTFGHEVDSARGFADFNDPTRIHSASDFQHAAYKIGYTFNWLYADSRDIAYFNSGNNPVRDPRTDPLLPVNAKYEWKGLNPDNQTADYTPFAQHPQVVNQDFITSWNNKQALDYWSPDGFYGTVYRSQTLDDRVRAGIAGGRKMSLTDLVNAMEDAGTVDLRADKNLPYILRIIGMPSDPKLADAVAKLRAWVAAGSHRRAPNATAPYDHADAIRILDAWYPLLVKGEFQPALGPDLFKALTAQIEIDNAPNNHGSHLGSAYDNGWYGYVQKDLRDLLAGVGSAPRRRVTARHPKHKRKRARRHARTRRRHAAPHRRHAEETAKKRAGGRHVKRHAKRHIKRHTKHRTLRDRRRPAGRSADRPLAPYHRVYCGNGSLAACRAMLLATLAEALAVDPAKLYSDDTCASAKMPSDQRCYDSITFRPLGAITQPQMAWINRPTYQQAVEIQNHGSR